MELAFVFIIGILVGLIIAWVIKPKAVGALRVDHSDPDGPYLFLELETDPENLSKREEVTLKVKFKDYIPHK